MALSHLSDLFFAAALPRGARFASGIIEQRDRVSMLVRESVCRHSARAKLEAGPLRVRYRVAAKSLCAMAFTAPRSVSIVSSTKPFDKLDSPRLQSCGDELRMALLRRRVAATGARPVSEFVPEARDEGLQSTGARQHFPIPIFDISAQDEEEEEEGFFPETPRPSTRSLPPATSPEKLPAAQVAAIIPGIEPVPMQPIAESDVRISVAKKPCTPALVRHASTQTAAQELCGTTPFSSWMDTESASSDFRRAPKAGAPGRDDRLRSSSVMTQTSKMLYRDDGTLWRSPTLQRVVLVPDVSESIESSIADAANEAIGQMVARLHEVGPGCPWTICDKAHIEYRKRGCGKKPKVFRGRYSPDDGATSPGLHRSLLAVHASRRCTHAGLYCPRGDIIVVGTCPPEDSSDHRALLRAEPAGLPSVYHCGA